MNPQQDILDSSSAPMQAGGEADSAPMQASKKRRVEPQVVQCMDTMIYYVA